ncbi:precorrin-8X methylmutase [Desulfofustis limnaeus]|jgi:precorrin-8X/cobalt-precorrin-8 methylmutase|uniref:Precorrin-8X methylmutase n=1 Tax=Desulfofustis limnaeus TaxID=2740163 RepID=A0ABM7W8B0_9BACT|nr:precorrin-8X methylmutase [Desulfofustis limnaeus]MDX9896359.1 precorrin-8X methylmutase [Desulfofustis sp.]BDD87159.1 precorrin-8X methylmutase [Desulfofustis limnaeus]
MYGEPIQDVAPDQIERLSFTLIEREFQTETGIDPASIEPSRFRIIQRVIHATGDFSFARSLVFHERAIEAGIESIRQGRPIVIDVTMGAAGISRSLLSAFGGSVICRINDAEIIDEARRHGRTRSDTALRRAAADDPGIIAVGNAPTALLAVMEMIASGEMTPKLVIGVPVGFVNASESKEILMRQRYPFIANHGRKGGSPVAVATINALLRLAHEQERL